MSERQLALWDPVGQAEAGALTRFAGSTRSTLLSGGPAQEGQAEHGAPLWVELHRNPRMPADLTCPSDQPLRVHKDWNLLRAPGLLLSLSPDLLQARVLPLTSEKLRS